MRCSRVKGKQKGTQRVKAHRVPSCPTSLLRIRRWVWLCGVASLGPGVDGRPPKTALAPIVVRKAPSFRKPVIAFPAPYRLPRYTEKFANLRNAHVPIHPDWPPLTKRLAPEPAVKPAAVCYAARNGAAIARLASPCLTQRRTCRHAAPPGCPW
jgi:hypothetical protein